MRTLAIGGVADGEVLEGREDIVLTVPRVKRSPRELSFSIEPLIACELERSYYRVMRLKWSSGAKGEEPRVWSFWVDTEIKHDGEMLDRIIANYRPVHKE